MNECLGQMARDITGRKEKNLLIFIKALKQCMAKESYEKISVRDIVDAADKSRQTFYRCCENKYDLVNKYLGMLILRCYGKMKEGMNLEEALTLKFQTMVPEKDLFSKAFRSNDYESLHRYTHRLIKTIYMDMYDEMTWIKMGEEEQILLDMHCEGSVYATVKWSLNEIDKRPEEMARLLIEAMPVKLKTIFSPYLD